MNVSYNEIVRNGNNKLKAQIRKEMALFALKHGNASAAKEYGVDSRTVGKWVDRYTVGEPLTDRSSKPHSSPKATCMYWRFLIIDKAKEELKRLQKHRASKSKPIKIDAAWLKRAFKIPQSVKTILKILHAEGLKKIRPQKAKRERSLEIFQRKQTLPPMYHWMVDTKHMLDIHGYAPLAEALGLPKYQFTARDMRTGALFIGYGAQKSSTHTELFIDCLLGHLKRHGIDTTRVHIQTDNGSEFTTPISCDHASGFTVISALKYGSAHTLIPLGLKNWQSDVESSHRLIEDEFYLHHRVTGYNNFFSAANRYTRYFNTARHNRYKNGSPLRMLNTADSSINRSIFNWDIPDCDRLMLRSKLEELKAWHQQARDIDLQKQIRIKMRTPAYLPRLPALQERVA